MKVGILGIDQTAQGAGGERGHLPTYKPMFQEEEQGTVLRFLSSSPISALKQ